MPKCPECGNTEEASSDWFETVNDGVALVVCPSCDCVLGGWGAAI